MSLPAAHHVGATPRWVPTHELGAPASRLLLISQPQRPVREALLTEVIRRRLDRRLGRAMFDTCNWHQSWSDRYEDTPEMRERLRRVGERISAHAFTLLFNRIGGDDRWALLSQGRPHGFDDMLRDVQQSLLHQGLDAPGHTPHTTISYRAPEPLKPLSIQPVAWLVDEILLVAGGGDPYRYDVIHRWKLTSAPTPPQLPLF